MKGALALSKSLLEKLKAAGAQNHADEKKEQKNNKKPKGNKERQKKDEKIGRPRMGTQDQEEQ